MRYHFSPMGHKPFCGLSCHYASIRIISGVVFGCCLFSRTLLTNLVDNGLKVVVREDQRSPVVVTRVVQN